MNTKTVSQLEETTTPYYIMGSTETGSARKVSWGNLVDSLDFDALWDKMYIHAKSVVIQCRCCASHNAYTNPTCVRCGAPMGEKG